VLARKRSVVVGETTSAPLVTVTARSESLKTSPTFDKEAWSTTAKNHTQ
jgi:hypothetical protein